MISTVVKAGLNSSLKASLRGSTQIQAKRYLYPRMKSIIVRRRTPDEMGIAEKIAWGSLFIVVMFSYPFWVMYHLPYYRAGKKWE